MTGWGGGEAANEPATERTDGQKDQETELRTDGQTHERTQSEQMSEIIHKAQTNAHTHTCTYTYIYIYTYNTHLYEVRMCAYFSYLVCVYVYVHIYVNVCTCVHSDIASSHDEFKHVCLHGCMDTLMQIMLVETCGTTSWLANVHAKAKCQEPPTSFNCKQFLFLPACKSYARASVCARTQPSLKATRFPYLPSNPIDKHGVRCSSAASSEPTPLHLALQRCQRHRLDDRPRLLRLDLHFLHRSSETLRQPASLR